MIEAFSQLFAKARPIHGTGSFKAYLYKTARNLALRHKRKHRIPFLRLEELPLSHRAMGWRTRNCSAASGIGSCTPPWSS